MRISFALHYFTCPRNDCFCYKAKAFRHKYYNIRFYLLRTADTSRNKNIAKNLPLFQNVNFGVHISVSFPLLSKLEQFYYVRGDEKSIDIVAQFVLHFFLGVKYVVGVFFFYLINASYSNKL